MNACELTAVVTALSNYIASSYCDEEINLISLVLVQIGDTLATILAQKELCCNKCEKDLP